MRAKAFFATAAGRIPDARPNVPGIPRFSVWDT
jgi:hypothetical protein